MPDIEMRFNKDMLVLSAPIDAVLAKQGVDVEQDLEFINLIEPEAIHDLYRMEQMAGAQCLVTNTAGITRARLSHMNLEDRALELATASLTVMKSLTPQHILAEIGPTRLPLDASSATSLKQNRDQYAQAARDFGEQGFDAFFINGIRNATDLQCALMGIRKVSGRPAFASVDIDQNGTLDGGVHTLEEAVEIMGEYEADVIGFATAAPLKQAVALAQRVKKNTDAPLLVQLVVKENNPKQGVATEENPYYCPDTMIEAATELRASGVQFLRACGNVSPAYTGALAAASIGFDVVGGS